MRSIIVLLIFLGMLTGIIFVVNKIKDSGISGIKMILLGINITMLGGILVLDTKTNLGGIEHMLALSGLIISIGGARKKDD